MNEVIKAISNREIRWIRNNFYKDNTDKLSVSDLLSSSHDEKEKILKDFYDKEMTDEAKESLWDIILSDSISDKSFLIFSDKNSKTYVREIKTILKKLTKSDEIPSVELQNELNHFICETDKIKSADLILCCISREADDDIILKLSFIIGRFGVDKLTIIREEFDENDKISNFAMKMRITQEFYKGIGI